MRIALSNIDVFAFIDADSPEAKAFTTYRGYVTALDALVSDEWGGVSYKEILSRIDPAGLHRLKSRQFRGNASAVRSLMLSAWLHEMHLHLVSHRDPGIVRIANHAAPVHAYYATSRAASAWHHALTSTAPQTHQALLKAVDGLITSAPSMYPVPWNLRCTALRPSPLYKGFVSPPQPCSNLSGSAPPLDAVAMCLRTTRDRRVKQLVTETKKQLKKDRAPNGEAARRDRQLHGTTLFDFLWRGRTRSSYGDPAMFYMGAISDNDVVGFLIALRNITAATSFLFEIFLAQRAPDVLADAATHFISRDRSGISDHVLVPRLRELDITTKP